MNVATQILVKAGNATLNSDFGLLMDARADLDGLYLHNIDNGEYDILVDLIEDMKLDIPDMNVATQILVKASNATLNSDFGLLMDARADLDELYPHNIDDDEYDILVDLIEDMKLIFNS